MVKPGILSFSSIRVQITLLFLSTMLNFWGSNIKPLGKRKKVSLFLTIEDHDFTIPVLIAREGVESLNISMCFSRNLRNKLFLKKKQHKNQGLLSIEIFSPSLWVNNFLDSSTRKKSLKFSSNYSLKFWINRGKSC